MPLIYIVEDDPSICEIETLALKNGGYEVKSFPQAEAFWRAMKKELPELVLLDVMLPDEDGFSIAGKLRRDSRTENIPIIMLTAKTMETDMVKGFDSGADDYIRKPFSVIELLTRVRAVLRRTKRETSSTLEIGGILLDHDKHLVQAGGRQVELTFKEYELLRCLMLREGTALSREALMQSVWGTDYPGETRTVDMHVKTLRQKLGEYGKYIVTVRNVGYAMRREGVEE